MKEGYRERRKRIKKKKREIKSKWLGDDDITFLEEFKILVRGGKNSDDA